MISPKMLIKVCKDFLHEKDRIWDREKKRYYGSKRTRKRKQLLPQDYEWDVYLNWCTLNQSSPKQKKLYFNSMNVDIKLHKNHL